MLTKFIHWYNNVFGSTALYEGMVNTTESSPWHREKDVGVHTNMVVMEYLTRANDDKEGLLGAFAAAFHDVGKPRAMVKKWKEERGSYFAFNGHELISARMWEDWAVQNWRFLVNEFEFTPMDLFRVGYMIEMHKPWDLRKKDKLDALSLTMITLLVDHTFVRLVKADTWGRISDDEPENRAKVETWCSEFENRCIGLTQHSAMYEAENPQEKPELYVPIAASGAGKSTLFNTSSTPCDVFSLDNMRVELYGDDYALAYLKSTKDKHFRSKCNERYREMLRAQKCLFLDNTNTSRKNRRFFLDEARKRGYHLIALLLPVTLHTVISRQSTRQDKSVPWDAVERQYFNVQLPQIGEFDDIRVIDSNLAK